MIDGRDNQANPQAHHQGNQQESGRHDQGDQGGRLERWSRPLIPLHQRHDGIAGPLAAERPIHMDQADQHQGGGDPLG
ncbi:hypothetical protein D3C73_1356330 [compost metagenome]